jgi:hypothetical protein
MLAPTLVLLLAAAPAEVAQCTEAIARVKTHEAPERIDAFQACGPLFNDSRLRVAWYGIVHTSPFDAAPILALAVGEKSAGGPNACARAKVAVDICGSDRARVGQISSRNRASQWRTVFLKLLTVDFPGEQGEALFKAFSDKWAVLFPDEPPPKVSNEGPLKVSGTINRRAVLEALGAVKPALLKCLDSPREELTLRWTVEAGGKVTQFAVFSPEDATKVECLTKAFRAVVMPKPPSGGAAVLVWTPDAPE